MAHWLHPHFFTWPALTCADIINLSVAEVRSQRLPSSLIGLLHLFLMKEAGGKSHTHMSVSVSVCVCVVCVCVHSSMCSDCL